MTKRVTCKREAEQKGIICKCPSVAQCRLLGGSMRPFPKQTDESQRKATLSRRKNLVRNKTISLAPIRGASADE